MEKNEKPNEKKVDDPNIKKVNVKTVPADTMINLPISGSYYHRLNRLLTEYGELLTLPVLVKSIHLIKKDAADKDPVAFNLETLMILLKSIEAEFEKEGLMVDETLEVDLKEAAKYRKNLEEDPMFKDLLDKQR